MRKFKVITDFSDKKDAELDVDAANATTGLDGNANFTFSGNQLKDFKDDATAYHDSLAALATGGKNAVTAKNVAKEKLLKSFSVVAVVVNQQADGDLGKLQTSGIELAEQPKFIPQPMPINFRVENGNNGAMNVVVDKSSVTDHGTVFAYTPAANASSDINLWTLKPANGHNASIKGLPAGVAYLFSAAYKGRDGEDLVWAAPITKYVSN